MERHISEEIITSQNSYKTKVISAFPGLGKSEVFKKFKNSDITILDSDSSIFSWLEDGVTRNPDFPNNYIQHIKAHLGIVDIIMVSSHEIVRQALNENRINTTLFYPDHQLYSEYLERYSKRGNTEGFINMMMNKFHSFVDEINNESLSNIDYKMIVNSGIYLSDFIVINNEKDRFGSRITIKDFVC